MEAETETQSKKRPYASAFNSQTQTVPPNSNSQAKPKRQRGCDNPNQKVTPKDGCETTEDRMFLHRLVNYLKTQTKYSDITDAKFIVERKLTQSDVDKVQARLALTKKQIRTPFLTNSLELALQWKDEHDDNVKIDVKAIVGSNLKEYNLALSRWNYHVKDNNNNHKDDSNQKKKKKIKGNNNNNNNSSNGNSNNGNNDKKRKKTGWKYVLKNQWNDLRKENNLQVGDVVRLVSFSSHNKLHIAVLRV